MRRVLALVVAGAIFAAPVSSARATPVTAGQDARARAYFANGRALGAKGRYGEALAAFSAGYDLSRRPLFLFNMAECARALGYMVRARQYYELYLREAPAGPLRAVTEARLTALPPAPPALPDPSQSADFLAPARVADRTPAPPVRVELLAPAPRTRDEPSAWKSPWLWAGAGVLLAAGTVVLFTTMRTGDEPTCGAGCVDLR